MTAANAQERAREASGDELMALLHEADEPTLRALLEENPHIEEPHVLILLRRLDLPATILEALVAQPKWLDREAVRFRLAAHPHTPRGISVRFVRQVYVFHLVELSRGLSTPAEVRRLAEDLLVGRVPHLPLGQKLTLARAATARVAGALVAEGHPHVLKTALNNSFLTESQILKVLARTDLAARVVAAIAQHPKWSVQYHVRMALVRHRHTPFPAALAILRELATRDLQVLKKSAGLPPFVHQHIVKEIERRTGGG